jgi:nitroreductase
MDFTKLINQRESIRDYDPQRPVSADILERIINAGRLAPSACNLQPWEFLVIQSPEMLEKVRACYHRQWFKDAPHILVITGLAEIAWIRSFDKYNSVETDLAIAMTHIILAAENEGVGTCYIEAYDPAILRNALQLGEQKKVFGITPLGYPHEGFSKKGNKIRKPLNEVMKYL